MRILCCLNRDLASNLALNLLLPVLARHEVRIGLTEQVGAASLQQAEPQSRSELRMTEQRLFNEMLFPLVERANLPDDGKRHLTFSEIERHRGIRIDVLTNPNSPAGLDAVAAFAPDLILTVRYGAILRPPVIAVPRFGVLNLHSGILPTYRGVLATFRALLNGDAQIGCTLHYIRDATIDTGDIVGIARTAVDPQRSLLWHVLRLYPAGIEMIGTAIGQLVDGIAPTTTAQPPTEGAYYSYPTAADWEAFLKHGWHITQARDFAEILQRYLP